MQIKPIIIVAGAIAWMFLEWTAIAAAAPNPPGDAVNYDGHTARAGETFILQAMAEDETDANTEVAPQAKSEEQDMMKTAKPVTTMSVRNTRPRIDRHKDARACLDAGNNEAVIKCANKYR